MRVAAELAAELGDDDGALQGFRVDCDLLKRAAKRARGQETSATNKRFRYQLPLKRNGKSVKLFHNGSVHATGCTSPLEFLDMVDALQAFVRETAERDVRLVDFDIQLINTLFVVVCPATRRPMTIAPGALLRHLATPADFDTERHPSVKIPVTLEGAKVATVCVFQTGSVSIMGAKRPAHVALAFETVCDTLDACAAQVCAPDRAAAVRTTTAKQALALADGYPFNLLSCCCQL
jgi:TATA-box binding protein (TBP) (component of TFIID and TFIIIB)